MSEVQHRKHRRAGRMGRLVTVAFVGVIGVIGCDDGGGDIEPAAVPRAAEAAAILDFLDDRVYSGDGWRAETPEPRPRDTAVSPHARVQVFQNEILIHGRDQTPYPPDSMAVKVMYDGDAVVGHAVLWQVPDAPSLTWFCYGPTNRCGLAEQSHPRDAPVFGDGTAVVCGQCHGGMVFTEITP